MGGGQTDTGGRDFDVVVVGAGSGGIGAALAAARGGLTVLLVEQHGMLGGTATVGGVSVWETGTGGTGIPFEIYRRLRRLPNAVGVCSIGRHICWPPPGEAQFTLGGELVIDPDQHYVDTLQRHGTRGILDDEAACRRLWHAVVFEPEAYNGVVQAMLQETGRCTVLTDTAMVAAESSPGRVQSVSLTDGRVITASAYIDCTADALLCRACGCETMFGQEAQNRFGEPDAPETADGSLNGVTLIYRVSRREDAANLVSAKGAPGTCWWQDAFPVASISQYPCGDLSFNMLPRMEGREWARLDQPAAYRECQRRVHAHWRHCQRELPEYRDYRLCWIAPVAGVREGPRVVGEYVLTQHGLLAGLSGQCHDDVVALADHAVDVHGSRSTGCVELREPYGVPYRCLLPRGFENLLIACRGASFSSIAASSCRLSRTMMQLGQAAGTAAALAKRMQVTLPQVPADALREALCKQHVQLDWPLPQTLRDHLAAEDCPEE